MFTWWKYLGCNFKISGKETSDDEKKITRIINQINYYHEYEHKWCNDWKQESNTSANIGS